MKAKYIRAVDANDVDSVRLFLSNELMLDPRGDSFREMKNLAESRIVNLYEAHEGKSYVENPSEWNEEVLFEIKNDLDSNFSRERLAFYEKVAKNVLKEKADQLDKEESEELKRNTFISSHSSSRGEEEALSRNKNIYTGVTVAGAAVTVIGICVSKTVIAAVGALGLAVGGIMLYNESKK